MSLYKLSIDPDAGNMTAAEIAAIYALKGWMIGKARGVPTRQDIEVLQSEVLGSVLDGLEKSGERERYTICGRMLGIVHDDTPSNVSLYLHIADVEIDGKMEEAGELVA